MAAPLAQSENAVDELQIGRALIEAGRLSENDFARVRRMRESQGGSASLSAMLIRLGLVSEQDIARHLAELLQLPLIDRDDFPEQPLFHDKLSYRFLKESHLLPLLHDDGLLRVAMADPQDGFTLSALQMATGCEIEPCVGVESELDSAVERLYGEGQGPGGGEAPAGLGDEINDLDVEQLKDMASEAPVIRLVNLIIQRAVEARASDIHIEPFDLRLKVRYRIDGVLQEGESPPVTMSPAVISRVKIMAKLNIAERRLPQDGRIEMRVQGNDLDIRVSTIPTMHGESVVLRLLNRESVVLDFEALGFTERTRAKLESVLNIAHGMIMVTGPTGSGKTTTLYTALNKLNTESRKLITVEDPVEYQLEGINQIQVKPAIGLTFAGALRSIVRQDPDVIMVGEMRDLETARICVQSALTGHLVLSTLHTNDAASSVTRLLEMGVEDYLLTSTLNAVIGQRLVRKLCPHCREAYTPLPEMVQELGLNRFSQGEITLHRPVGCKQCNGTGYHGRVAIQELLIISDELRRLVLRHADAGQLLEVAKAEGMHTMYDDGCVKSLAGITNVEEVIRVTQEA
ncbi:type II secretion system ATPase GspE [Marinobacterium arenosum]|uniref:type II secretion system ATPase GspE n=1 Tax=Marinobacterium arenosum TaxID=2862496 RepID=UPI001C964BAC|nr:type II secretion system ATPase GspE [Marinobacterium arenosum]MBY4678548.1 type II secretion system ATPase GspE [Marinobacterium arenosum]